MEQFDLARSFLGRAEALEEAVSDADPAFVLRLRLARGALELHGGALAKGLDCVSRARTSAHRTGDPWSRVVAPVYCTMAFSLLGDCERAEAAAREVTLFSEAKFWIDWGAVHAAAARINSHGAQGVRGVLSSLRPLLDGQDFVLAIYARTAIAYAFANSGDLDAAEREATTVLERAPPAPFFQCAALGVLALVALRRGLPAEAMALADRALRMVTSGGMRHLTLESILHLARAEALRALGRVQDAHGAIREAKDRILGIAATLEDVELRASYLMNLDANARTLQLAKEWLGE